ncbi:MAG: FAD:protein FMN transferase [Verrucomicrobia bacterium]|nr:FAD:protein FMN transferase [Verrucomicrobiota bacterium]
MKPPLPNAEARLRRARPLLGTVVEIQVSGLAPAQLERAISRAFAAITHVQMVMSFHDPASDLSRINRLAARRAVRVDAATWTVLRHARALTRVSEGRFDPSIAPILQRWGLLPGVPHPRQPETNGSAICLLPGRRVRFLAPLTLDLGGIAKGYAVDRAVAVLRRAGVPAGLVNAGGDLRVFGNHAAPVHVRHPTKPGLFFPLGELRDGALATSALTYSGKIQQGTATGALVDPRNGTACGQNLSITVLARSAWLADALTKVVAVDPAAARPILARYGARAVILDTQGRADWLDTPLRHVA